MAKIIGISGGSASGKSTFSKKLVGLFEKDHKVKLIGMDWHYKKAEDRPHVPSHISGIYYTDDNSPDSIDFEAFHKAIDDALCEGNDIIILEGLFVLSDEYIKDRLDLKVFVDCLPDERIVRRLRRNTGWGMSFDEVSSVYLDMVRFRHDMYVEPYKWTADIIVNGSGNTDKVCEMIYKNFN
ncbi:MAG: hypothetical protein HFE30_04375 [Clostridiales bacterium]|nr:hypothetical protein [Clostridiales bacterium]